MNHFEKVLGLVCSSFFVAGGASLYDPKVLDNVRWLSFGSIFLGILFFCGILVEWRAEAETEEALLALSLAEIPKNRRIANR
ncbi:MAG: hypothetical protein WC551_04130 [Patescibacteria group bacterium]